jgi:hypothetical protein
VAKDPVEFTGGPARDGNDPRYCKSENRIDCREAESSERKLSSPGRTI